MTEMQKHGRFYLLRQRLENAIFCRWMQRANDRNHVNLAYELAMKWMWWAHRMGLL